MGLFGRGRDKTDDRVDDSDLNELDDELDDDRAAGADGPYDSAQAPADRVERIDLGSLLVPAAPGLQLQLELDQAQQTVSSVNALLAGSAAQLQAFAAPKSGGLWEQVRDELAAALVAGGGTAEVIEGPLGPELLASMRTGSTRTPVRFLGVDGPRWFLRVVLNGPAASSSTAAQPLLDLVRGVVVVRGSDARPPRELLPLSVPQTAGGAAGEAGESDSAGPGGSTGDAGKAPQGSPAPARSHDDLRPFERGPEITEVR